MSFIFYRGTSGIDIKEVTGIDITGIDITGIDIDLRRVDIDQCPQRGGVALPLNIFAGTDKCKARTTEVIYKYSINYEA